jgi:hypothetical protein
MDFELPLEAADLAMSIRRRVDHSLAEGRPGRSPFALARWTEFLRWDLLDQDAVSAARLLQVAAAFIEVGRGAVPGPVLEAYLAVASGSKAAADAIGAGEVVTSVPDRVARQCVVGWGSVAALTVDQLTGRTLAHGALPQVELAYGFPHGRLRTDGNGDGEDKLELQRWVAGAALLTGLCLGAIELVSGHVKVRKQFGQPLAAFQAIQFPLAECVASAEGMRLCVIDAAWRASVSDGDQIPAAALAWISCDRASRRIADVCHQSMGAAGFCDEIGLTHYTWAIAWLRLSIGNRAAQHAVLAGRQVGAAGPPPSLVLSGFHHRLPRSNG